MNNLFKFGDEMEDYDKNKKYCYNCKYREIIWPWEEYISDIRCKKNPRITIHTISGKKEKEYQKCKFKNNKHECADYKKKLFIWKYIKKATIFISGLFVLYLIFSLTCY